MSQVLRNGFFSDGKFLFLSKEIISQVKNVLLLEKAFLKVNSVSSGKKTTTKQPKKEMAIFNLLFFKHYLKIHICLSLDIKETKHFY